MSYISVRVSTLRGDQKIGFNAYVKINDKMILYLRQGDSFEGPRLKKLKEKKLRQMFILKEEEEKYLNYLKTNLESAYDSKTKVDLTQRAEIIQGSQQSNVETVFENAQDAGSYNKAKEEAGKYVEFILNTTGAANSLLNIENTDQSLAHHGVAVSTLSVALAKRLGLADEKRVQLMALGALLHDYGHNLNPIDLGMPLTAMTPENLKIWKDHPRVGAENVRNTKHFDPVVMNIILQHEEKCNGSGPLGMIEKNQDPLATIVASANTVDRLLSFEKVAKADIPKRLTIDYTGCHPLAHIQNLNEMIKGL
jgi:putative nucleotidyltransferase with HDIG domain